jgi:hypothetical protein
MSGSPGGFVTFLAQKYNGLIVSLEHRWYELAAVLACCILLNSL